MSVEQFGYKQELHRALTFRDLLVYGMIFMVPIAPFGVLATSGTARGMVALAYLIGMVAMFFTAMSYWSMSRAFPVSGSVYAYAQRGIHPIVGFFCRLADPAGLYSGAVAALYRQRRRWRPCCRACRAGCGLSALSRLTA